MALLLTFLGPTAMIFLGLHVMNSVPVTFLLFYGWLFVVPFTEMLLFKRVTLSDTLRQFGITKNRKNLYHGFCAGVVFSGAIILGGYFFHGYLFDQANLQALLVKWNFSGDLLIWLVLILIIINPLLEEIYWRGYVFRKLDGKFKTKSIIFLTLLFYTLYHLLSVIPLFKAPYNLLVILPVFFAGIIWGYMRLKSKSLLGSILSHILADTGIMTVYVLFIK